MSTRDEISLAGRKSGRGKIKPRRRRWRRGENKRGNGPNELEARAALIIVAAKLRSQMEMRKLAR